ncbi:aromatic acid exporter family protein [Cohnella algarum]|uniref:aromatic acid exporter family protein n=1 Tax=Cohnella algarum TaxID=2044859 RepID=UPI001967AF20|nr:aromatic acid exporter family protein [Cohnella algarum]MBN2981876.1 aromatic acid exporter family protein [Cohnella algarum]
MKVNIGFRTIKTAVGVSVSVLIAQALKLEYYSASGILTLLCIQKSRKQSNKAVFSRLVACMLGMIASTALFEIIGYAPYSFLVLMLLFIPLCVKLRIQEGLASSSVIIMHVYMNRQIEASFFLNEVLVILIGLGVALLINWYMPSIDKQLNRMKAEADRLISVILSEFSVYLKNGYTLWDGKEMLQLSDLLDRALRMAQLEEENYRPGKKGGYRTYFHNKRKQYELLERMLPHVSQITAQVEQGLRIGQFMERLSEHMKRQGESGGDRHDNFYESLRGIREYHKGLPLPETREEFETRANLFAAANELERFIDTL